MSVRNVCSADTFMVRGFLETETLYDKCFQIVKYDMIGHRLAESFEHWGIHSVADLEKGFNESEITILYAILQRYFLLHYGSIDLQKCLELLNVSNTIEILNPDNDLFSTFDTLFSTEQNCSHKFHVTVRALEAYVKIRLSPEKILKLFDKATDRLEYSSLLANLYCRIEELSLEERCRLTFFLSISLSFIEQYNSNTTILDQVNNWTKKMSTPMACVLKFVHAALSKIRNHTVSTEKTLVPPAQFRFAKPNIAALPNCIPHAANSCYMASTLTPLAFVCDPEIQEAMKRFEFMDPMGSAARDAFCSLYNNLKAEAITDITIAQVNNLRSTLQTAFSYRFFNPYASTQEDAGDFLMCVFENLLQMGASSPFYEKHTFQQLESSVQIEPEHYNYDEPLATKYRKLDQNMTDISLEDAGEGVKFADLATGIRRTNDFDLNAYRKPSVETGPKYQTIMAHHQEQFLVESAENAPNFFCARLRRFSQNPHTGVRTKHQTPVEPSLTIQFQIKGAEDSDQRVAYELAAVTVHSGLKADNGHYYCYLRHEGKIYKYNDLTGAEAASNEAQVWQDVLTNGYIFYYKKIN